MSDHQILVWGPAGEGERSSRGTRLPAGYVWTCTCGAGGTGLPSEAAADEAADAHEASPDAAPDLGGIRSDPETRFWEAHDAPASTFESLRSAALTLDVDPAPKLRLVPPPAPSRPLENPDE